jgi:pilus assembly protein CpaF
MVDFLRAAVKSRVNILVTGGTGSGKTTLLNVLSGFIPDTERIITIEDSAELQLQQPHIVRLETRPANIEGKGEVVQRDLVKNALRMRPDRIVVGEVRGAEALDMLQAMNTGHDGSLTTIHANSPRDALTRLEHMVGMSGVPIPALVVRQQIAAALNLVIDVERMPDGRRIVTSIQEITGMEETVVNMQEIFNFQRETVDARGQVIGSFRATGIRPLMLKRFKEHGVAVDDDIFDPERVYE